MARKKTAEDQRREREAKARGGYTAPAGTAPPNESDVDRRNREYRESRGQGTSPTKPPRTGGRQKTQQDIDEENLKKSMNAAIAKDGMLNAGKTNDPQFFSSGDGRRGTKNTKKHDGKSGFLDVIGEMGKELGRGVVGLASGSTVTDALARGSGEDWIRDINPMGNLAGEALDVTGVGSGIHEGNILAGIKGTGGDYGTTADDSDLRRIPERVVDTANRFGDWVGDTAGDLWDGTKDLFSKDPVRPPVMGLGGGGAGGGGGGGGIPVGPDGMPIVPGTEGKPSEALDGAMETAMGLRNQVAPQGPAGMQQGAIDGVRAQIAGLQQDPNEIASRNLAAQMAQAGATAGGGAAQRAAAFQSLNALPSTQAAARQEAQAANAKAAELSAGFEGKLGDQDLQQYAVDVQSADNIFNSSVEMQKFGAGLDQDQKEMMAAIWTDFQRIQAQYAGLTSQEHIAILNNEMTRYGIDKTGSFNYQQGLATLTGGLVELIS